MTPADNILYFRNGFDVRLCPKNAMTLMKWAYGVVHYTKEEMIARNRDYDTRIGQIHRMKYIMEQAYSPTYPFRKKSVKIAIKRDPVKRFQSAAAYKFKDRSPVLPIVSIDDIIHQVAKGTMKDVHFFSQSYFLGRPEDYDMIYDINDLPDLVRLIYKECGTVSTWEEKLMYEKKNVSTYHHNYDLLTPEQEKIVRKLYDKDYKNGWF